MRVVVDTNILISAAIKDRIPEKVILWIVANPLVFWFISDDILSEFDILLGGMKIDCNLEPKFL